VSWGRAEGAGIVEKNFFSDLFDNIRALIVSIPLNNGLGIIYVILNALALIFFGTIFGSSPTGGGGGIGGL